MNGKVLLMLALMLILGFCQIASGATVIQVSSSGSHTVALKSDGTVWAWGSNRYGQLGDGSTTDSPTPVQVSGLTGVTAVAAGGVHTAALKSDGTVWVCGSNVYGQLGDGTTNQSATPVRVLGLTGVTAISAGGYHTVALKGDHTVWTWGYNGSGQLGIPFATTQRTTPIQVSGLTDITGIATGLYHTVAMLSDGTVYAWGYNDQGELGNGSTSNSAAPVQVSGLTGVTAIAAGGYHTLALKGGTVQAWGWNVYGQLGDGITTQRTIPVQVLGLTGVTAIGAGGYHSVALKGDGTAWAWGSNSKDQLGDGTNTQRNTPVQVANFTGGVNVTAGWEHSLALKFDGTVRAWGVNDHGQLGDGTITPRTAVVQVVGLDKIAPTGSVTINGGAATTRNSVVALGLSATDDSGWIAQMRISNDGVFDTEPWENYAESKSWNLTAGDGTKTVYVKFKDPSNNESGATTASITLDSGISVSSPSANVTNTGPVSYSVHYTWADATVTLSAADITLNKTGTANGTVSVSSPLPDFRTVSVSGITGDGTLSIGLAAGSAHDPLGNTTPAVGPSASFTVDNTPPSVSISAPSVTAANTGPMSYTVTYNGADSVTLSPANIVLNKTGTADGTMSVSGVGSASKTVTISDITGDGTLSITIAAGTASDLAGNVATGTGPSASFTVDNTPPSVSIGAPSVVATNTGPVSYIVTYSRADSITLSPANITLNKTGTANGTIGVSGTGASTRTATISGITGDGTLGISVDAGSASDLAGNAASAAGPSASFAVDNSPPTIAISDPSVAMTTGGPVSYTVTYTGAESVTLSTADITLNKTGTANGVVSVSGSDLVSRTVTVSGITGDGTVSITIGAGSASDSVGNSAPAAGPSASFAVDNIAPGISISPPSVSVTNAGPVNYTVSYSGADSITLSDLDITLNKTGTANGVLSVSGRGTASRLVSITGITGNGSLSITIAAGTASDTVGNIVSGAGPSVGFTVDNTPSGISIGVPSADATSAGPVMYTVTYTGANSITLSDADITLNKTGTANGTVGVSGNGTASRTVIINGITGNGSLSITIAAGSASDSAGNTAPGAGPSATFIVDSAAPGIYISAPSTDKTNSGPVSYIVTYNGASLVTLSSSDVTLNKTGTANGVVGVSGTGDASRTVSISNVTGNGTLSITIAEGSASDSAGNDTPGAGPSASFAVDNSAPSVEITGPTTDPSFARNVSSLNLSGAANDETGEVVSVDWISDRGGSGTCTGTDSWSVSDMELKEGDNVITVTATDIIGNTCSTAITVTYIPSSPGRMWIGAAMVSVPIIPDSSDPRQVAGFQGNAWYAYNTAARSYAGYEDHFSWFEPVSAAPGRGFWSRFDELGGSAPGGMIPDQTDPVAIRLKPGWNIIGNPFIKPAKWDSDAITVRALSGETYSLNNAPSLVTNYAWGWDTSTRKYVLIYDQAVIPSAQGALQPWCGYWIRAYAECDLIIPAP